MIKKILLVDTNKDLLRMLAPLMRIDYNAEIYTAENLDRAKQILYSMSAHLIVCEFDLPDGTAEDLFTIAKDTGIALILFSSRDLSQCLGMKEFLKNKDQFAYIPKPFKEGQFVDALSRFLPKKEKSATYVDLPISVMEQFPIAPSPIFLKLGPGHYVKVTNENENHIENLIKYQKRGATSFSIQKSDLTNFYKGINEKIIKQLSQKRTSTKETVQLMNIIFEVSYEAISEFGVTETDVKTTNRLINKTISKLKNETGLKKYLTMVNKQSNFVKSHSMITIYLALALIKRLGLKTAEISEKFVLAAFFHDFGLNPSKLAIYEQHTFDHLDRILQAQIYDHPFKSASIFEKSKAFTDDTLKIMQQHHESPDGSGYPKGLTASQIKPLSCVFILCHDLASFLCRSEYNVSISQKYLRENTSYLRGNFQKPYEAFIKLMSKEEKK